MNWFQVSGSKFRNFDSVDFQFTAIAQLYRVVNVIKLRKNWLTIRIEGAN